MREGMKYFTDIEWPLAALIIFIVVFLMTIVIQQILYSRKKIDHISRLPLEGDAE